MEIGPSPAAWASLKTPDGSGGKWVWGPKMQLKKESGKTNTKGSKYWTNTGSILEQQSNPQSVHPQQTSQVD